MDFEIVLPHDTQNEMEEFVTDHFIGQASQLAAADALDAEMEKLAANPTLGAAPFGTPFESRRVHRFSMTIGDRPHTLEFLYRLHKSAGRIVIHGFRRIPPIAL